MAIKRRGVIARPGVHKNLRTGQDEVITWEELKEAVQFQNRIELVLEHPHTFYMSPEDRIGTVTQKVNEKKKQIDGEFWFFDEPKYWNKIPPDLKRKIIGGQEINMSAGYKVGQIVEGRQTSRKYDHIALDVNNPMQNVGIEKGSVRMESELPDDVRIEETPTIEGEKKEEVPKTEPYDPVSLGIMIGELKAEIKALREQVSTKPAVEETTEETRPEPETIPPPEPPKPETVVPQSAPQTSETDDDGQFVFEG
jgi:hypothetical protein